MKLLNTGEEELGKTPLATEEVVEVEENEGGDKREEREGGLEEEKSSIFTL